MNARLSLFIYNLLFPFALLLMLPNLLRRMARRGNYRHKFAQRLGFYDPETQARLAGIDAGGRTWIHSISVGETFLALKLARKMKALDPSLKIVVSVTTSTGFALADKSAADWLEVIYNPVDALPCVRHALKLVRPRQVIFIEAMWPNLLLGAKKRGIPIAMVPRLSERAERRFKKFRFFTGGFFGAVDCMCAQEPEDAPRLEAVGADPAKIHVTGGIKFDLGDDAAASRAPELRALVRTAGIGDGAPVLLAGSTFPGEEIILAQLFIDLRKKFADLFLILVPRHVERTPAILDELKPLGLNIALRTGIAKGAKPDCLIVDTTGELRDWYHVGSVIFIGKSLNSYGGQNPAEAAAAGKPVLFGPHMENFKNVARLLIDHGAAIQVAGIDELKKETTRLLADRGLREKMGANAPKALLSHQGATGRAAALLLKQRTEARPVPRK
jgi:3-deoxy-D-manno-octulosonic-acid transferase